MKAKVNIFTMKLPFVLLILQIYSMQLSNFAVTGLSNEAHRALKKYTSTGDNTDEHFLLVLGTVWWMVSLHAFAYVFILNFKRLWIK